MSMGTNQYVIYHPDTNTISALQLHNEAGQLVTPISVTDGAANPPGYLSKVVQIATPEHLLCVTPTFANPAAPVPTYLCYQRDSSTIKAIDETAFSAASPGRPSPRGDLNQWLLYDVAVGMNGHHTYTLKLPVAPVCVIKPETKDQFTGEPKYGNEFMFRWGGLLPQMIEVQCDLDDIVDPQGFLLIPTVNATTFAETSAGLSQVKATEQILPQDGLEHTVKFRLRYNVNGDVGGYVETVLQSATHRMAPPNAPVSLSASLLRDRIGEINDVVHLEWQKAPVNGGSIIDIYAHTILDKKHLIYTSNGMETSCRVDNVSRLVVREDQEPRAEDFRFFIQARNTSSKSDVVYAPEVVAITTKTKASKPLNPDEIAGTIREVSHSTLIAETYTAVLGALGALPTDGLQIVTETINRALLRIKEVLNLGGSVNLDNFGTFAAKWSSEKITQNAATGEAVITPASRGLSFTASLGLKEGTKTGTVMTDLEAKAQGAK